MLFRYWIACVNTFIRSNVASATLATNTNPAFDGVWVLDVEIAILKNESHYTNRLWTPTYACVVIRNRHYANWESRIVVWEYPKVFESPVNDLVDLKTEIEAVIEGISKQLLEDVSKSVCCCFWKCINSNGAFTKYGIQKMNKTLRWH